MFTLHNGDCLQVMPTIPSGSIDAIITDLPYGTTACKWDTIIPFEPMWKEVKRVLKPNGAFITTASQPFTSALIMSNPSMFKVEWIWIKNTQTGIALSKTQPMRKHESVLVFYDKKVTFNKQPTRTESEVTINHSRKGYVHVGSGTSEHHEGLKSPEGYKWKEYINPHTVLYFDVCHNRSKKHVHPTQKPVELYEYFIKTYTNEGETVLDFCMGSGTTIKAARRTLRNSIGIEKDKHYFEVAERTINDELL